MKCLRKRQPEKKGIRIVNDRVPGVYKEGRTIGRVCFTVLFSTRTYRVHGGREEVLAVVEMWYNGS